MDFEEDRMALEAYIREKTNWRDEDEVSPEEWSYYANEYMELHPISIEPIIIDNEDVLIYQRWTGEFVHYKFWALPPIMWQPGQFKQGVKDSIGSWFHGTFLHKLALYVGLAYEFNPEGHECVEG